MRALAALILMAAGALFAQDASPSKWKPIEFLFGNWTAKGGGASSGQGSGDFSFQPQLNQQIVVRKNFAEYTSGPEAGTRHDDLMVIYADAPGQPLRAIYFDSEGHTIRYAVKTPAANVTVFESEASQPGPQYKLSYELKGNELQGTFEVGGKVYLKWSSVKK